MLLSITNSTQTVWDCLKKPHNFEVGTDGRWMEKGKLSTGYLPWPGILKLLIHLVAIKHVLFMIVEVRLFQALIPLFNCKIFVGITVLRNNIQIS